MRSLVALALMLILSSSVLAVSIATPNDLDDLRLDEGDNYNLVFRLKAASTSTEVEFFIKADKLGLEFNNRDTYKKDYNLDPYELQMIEVLMEANQPGDYVVEYGFVDKGDGSTMFEQVVSRTFTLEVDGEGPLANETNNDTVGNGVNLTVPGSSSSSSSSSSTGGGSTGGGGGYVPPADSPTTTSSSSKTTKSDESANLQDVSAQGSSLTQGIVENGAPRGFSGVSLGGEPMDLNAEKLLILAMSVALLSLTLHGLTIASMRGEE